MRRRAPRELGEVLDRFRTGLIPATTLARVQAQWEGAVGAAVSSEAKPISESAGVLTVACRSAVWAQELDLMSSELLPRVNDMLGGDSAVRPLKALRFVVARS
ncbi:MAG: hypothetical protein NVSMB25_24840 [Thermoleophilaceae bacterium]